MTETNKLSDHAHDLEGALATKPPNDLAESSAAVAPETAAPMAIAEDQPQRERVVSDDVRGGALERWAPYVTGVLLALPVLMADYPPMTDLPFHEASVSILRHFGDPSMFPPGLYFRNFGHPNQLFHLSAWLLSYVVSTTMACKLVVATAVATLPIASARLATHVGASRWTALVVAPVALGWLFFMGLVANILGLTLLLALFPTLDRFMQKPTPRGAAKAIGGAVLLYFAHEAIMFDYAAAALLFTLAYPLMSKATLARLSVFAFCVVITLAQLVYQAPLFTKSSNASKIVQTPIVAKITGLPGILFGAYDQGASRTLFALSAFALALLAIQRWREREAVAVLR